MSRFLRLQIYNADNTQVEFDNATDTFWGIVIGTARLDRKIMQSELKFGELLANMLQIQVFGLDKNINLKNRKVVLSLRYDKKVYSHLVDDSGDYIVDSDGDRLLLSAPDIVDTEKALFTGYIDTSTMDTIKTDRTLIAYDKSYIFRDIDIATWWNTYWESHENDAITIATFRNSLLNAFNIQYEPKVLINDDAIITNWLINVTTLKLGTILSQLCEVQCCCPNVNADEILEFVTLGSTAHDLTSNLEGLNSIWKDFTTELVTGVAVYDTSKNLAQLIGTDSNVYNLAGNVFVLSMNTQQINSVGANILNAINTIQYTPCSLNLVTSDVEHNLGDSIITPNGNSYILTQTYSGSLLINEQIISPATKPTLNAEVNSINDEFIEGQKRAKIEQNIDEFYTEYTNYANNTSSMISQMSDRIVLKVNSDGQIVQVALTADPDTAATLFKVNANNLDLSATDVFNIMSGGTLNLQSKDITITTTNGDFSVTSDGVITAKRGQFGLFTIASNSLYYNNSAPLGIENSFMLYTYTKSGSILGGVLSRKQIDSTTGSECELNCDGIFLDKITKKSSTQYVSNNVLQIGFDTNESTDDSSYIWLGHYPVLSMYSKTSSIGTHTTDLYLRTNSIVHVKYGDPDSNPASYQYTKIYASAFTVQSSKLIKENITDMSVDMAKKLLRLNVVNFDYINGDKNQTGLIAEDVMKILPNVVSIPSNYDEKSTQKEIEDGKFPVTLGIDYSKLVPYLIKMVQLLYNEVEDLKNGR